MLLSFVKQNWVVDFVEQHVVCRITLCQLELPLSFVEQNWVVDFLWNNASIVAITSLSFVEKHGKPCMLNCRIMPVVCRTNRPLLMPFAEQNIHCHYNSSVVCRTTRQSFE
jgi:hypothetical protein